MESTNRQADYRKFKYHFDIKKREKKSKMYPLFNLAPMFILNFCWSWQFVEIPRALEKRLKRRESNSENIVSNWRQIRSLEVLLSEKQPGVIQSYENLHSELKFSNCLPLSKSTSLHQLNNHLQVKSEIPLCVTKTNIPNYRKFFLHYFE